MKKNASKKLKQRKQKAEAYLKIRKKVDLLKAEEKFLEIETLAHIQEIKRMQNEVQQLQSLGIDGHKE